MSGKSSETYYDRIPKSPEMISKEASTRLKGIFAIRAAHIEATAKMLRAEENAKFTAPEGFVFKIRALEDGTLTSIWDAHKPRPTYFNRKAGDIVYASEIGSRADGYSTSSFTSLSYPASSEIKENITSHDPVIINNDRFELELVEISAVLREHEEEFQRRLNS